MALNVPSFSSIFTALIIKSIYGASKSTISFFIFLFPSPYSSIKSFSSFPSLFFLRISKLINSPSLNRSDISFSKISRSSGLVNFLKSIPFILKTTSPTLIVPILAKRLLVILPTI